MSMILSGCVRGGFLCSGNFYLYFWPHELTCAASAVTAILCEKKEMRDLYICSFGFLIVKL